MNIVIIDLEFNQAFDFSKGKPTIKNDSCPFEVIQMGAVKLNNKYEKIDEFSTYIKPIFYKRMHPYVQKITHLTMADLEKGLTFHAAMEAFTRFCDPQQNNYYLGCWGEVDLPQLFRNLEAHQMPLDFVSHQYVNIQREMSLFLNKPQSMHVGLSKAVEICEIAENNHFHDALYDALYTAEILRFMLDKNHPAPQIYQYNPYKLLQKDKGKQHKNYRRKINEFQQPMQPIVLPPARHMKPRQYKTMKKPPLS